MPLATNVLLQANVTATAKSGAANNAIKAADSGKDDASSFSSVYARQSKDKVADRNDPPAKQVREKSVPEKDKTVAGKDKADTDETSAADDSTVADSGNALPADAASANTDDKSDGEVVAEVLTPPVTDPALDPALQIAAVQTPAALAAGKAEDEARNALPVVAALAGTQATTAVAEDDSFDPEADPLDGLHAVQLALENANSKAQSAQHANTASRAAGNAENDQSQNAANNLAALSEQLPSDESSTESSDKSFSNLISDGLKDTKSATGDTRVDNFAERLAALSQAAQPARTTAPATLMNQPLAMNQSGWSEGIVDRVMYLSSQNLKSAEIKLEPAELGRLDIRVNMAPEQQTQVTFMSAHVGVREALESQMSRLRESFTQQGLGQVDVNVSDQSQQQAQQQAQEQASRAQRGGRSGGGSGSGDDLDDTATVDATTPVSQPAARVIGSSEIDYYA